MVLHATIITLAEQILAVRDKNPDDLAISIFLSFCSVPFPIPHTCLPSPFLSLSVGLYI